ncbi:UDP-N-acetylglucosamine 2-epimerase [Legionella busanensis]|uniref:UDP-N-acetylglucosamine 2-epimerase (non-hydrolyzing) n=1 Tax=Legionella busanensis TaxID=190655 RepID=A0A378JTD1_9GAMM|nr:UDP-N-acetylglucosamine 2-epimerase (non-hydrolyzing) [Legionella busanensis]STX51432.1 UDP-N-acetylglucosamine 2-epimerase [Legionella busanensis]
MEKCIHIGCIIGTRPEIIKMFPIIKRLKACSWAKVTVINTAQHRSLLDDILISFQITPDIDLNTMTINQSLGTLTSNLCSKLEALVLAHKFDVLLAAGDTTTVFVSALTAFYHNIYFGHIEAGLRTYNTREPYPEEINRVLTAPLATWHFAPTQEEKDNLIRENISPTKIIVTGNPVIDTLYWTLKNTTHNGQFKHLNNIVIVTAHRRENFGQHLENICAAIINLTKRYDLNFVFPVHPNPHVQAVINNMLAKNSKIHLISPLRYIDFVHLMQQCMLIMTDSGGIQEEAPALSKPVLVLRHTTERPAIITEGVGLLVGTEKENIINTVESLLEDPKIYTSLAKGISPYGDGHASEKIVNYLQGVLL